VGRVARSKNKMTRSLKSGVNVRKVRQPAIWSSWRRSYTAKAGVQAMSQKVSIVKANRGLHLLQRRFTNTLVRTDEVTELADRFSSLHGERLALIASTWHLSSRLLSDFGAAHGSDLTPLVDLLQDALRDYAGATGIAHGQIERAVRDLIQAGQTAAVLASLPD